MSEQEKRLAEAIDDYTQQLKDVWADCENGEITRHQAQHEQNELEKQLISDILEALEVTA